MARGNRGIRPQHDPRRQPSTRRPPEGGVQRPTIAPPPNRAASGDRTDASRVDPQSRGREAPSGDTFDVGTRHIASKWSSLLATRRRRLVFGASLAILGLLIAAEVISRMGDAPDGDAGLQAQANALAVDRTVPQLMVIVPDAPDATAVRPASQPATQDADGSPEESGDAGARGVISAETSHSAATAPHSESGSELVGELRPDGETLARSALPQVTFLEASVRDQDVEAADLERRRSVIGLFERLRVAAEHSVGYDREALFDGWLYSDGLSTRERVLRTERQLDGGWFSAYDASVVTDKSQLDIDHLVPLAEAWESGGHLWTEVTWTRYANDLGDPRSLIAVSASTNRSKGARDPAEWWPPHSGYRCQYAVDWIAVKVRWDLAIDTAEQASIDAQLGQCAGADFDFVEPALAQVQEASGRTE